MIKFKKITPELKTDIENEVFMMFAAHRDTLWNRWQFRMEMQEICLKVNPMTEDLPHRDHPNSIRLDANDGFYGEVFGIMRGLAVAGYGYLGSDTQDAVQEGKGTVPEQNFKWWLHELVNRILEETNYPNSTKEGTYEVLKKYKMLCKANRMEKKVGVRK